MLFKLFRKDYNRYKDRGDRMFQDGRYAEARHEYEEALSILKPEAPIEVSGYLKDRILEAGNQLASMNLQEAMHSYRIGNVAKALEHAELALEQAEDETIRGNAENFIQELELPAVHDEPRSHGNSCSSCSGSHNMTSVTSDISTDFLSMMERFELLVHPLPGDLPDRYRQMGEKFAYSYVALHDERVDEGYALLIELSSDHKSDILEYEIAIIDFQRHRLSDCERHLRNALLINPGNPLCHLAMVQLMIETGRLPEAAGILEQMTVAGHLGDQAMIMHGDVLQMMGDSEAALERYLSALGHQSVAKTAAQKAVPLLEAAGRTADAQALAKRYLKGCR